MQLQISYRKVFKKYLSSRRPVVMMRLRYMVAAADHRHTQPVHWRPHRYVGVGTSSCWNLCPGARGKVSRQVLAQSHCIWYLTALSLNSFLSIVT